MILRRGKMKILAVGGGSGGHVTPVVAVFKEIIKQQKSAQLYFWCDKKFLPQAEKTMASAFGKKVKINELKNLKTSIKAVSTAIMNIPLVGWILALIAVLTAAFTWLWNNVGEFRGFFYGIWNVIKLAFSGIWEVIKTIINLIVAHFKWWWNNVKTVFNWIVGIVSQAWNWVAAKFQWAWNFIKTKALQIYETLKNVFGGVFNFFKSIFGNIWNIISKVFDKIWQKIKGIIDFLKPLADAIGKLFSKASGEFSKGMKQGVKEVADEKRQKVISKKRYDDIMKKEQSSLDFNPAGSVSADNFLGGEKKGKEKTKVRIMIWMI
jgi:hypothetical protein